MTRLTPRWLLAFLLLAASGVAADNGPFHPSRVDVYYSPSGGCTDACVATLDAAKKTVYVQAYSFTSAPIAQALANAKSRGVAVKVILDKSDATGNGSEANFIALAGIPTWLDPKHAIAHNKVMIIDEAVVITGSFNFTTAAELHNAENMLVIHGKALAERYLTNWNEHLAHSVIYVPVPLTPTPVSTPK